MGEDNRFSKVQILIQHKKYAEAEKILKELLASDATNVHYLSMLSEVYLQQDKLDAAKAVIENAIGLSPDSSYLFYIRSRIAMDLYEYDEAEECLEQAISLDPVDANYVALLAHIKLVRKKFETALELANKALALDAENMLALNTRSSALLKLKKNDESFLKYAFWMGNLTAKYQWGVIVGFYLAVRGLRTLSANNSAMQPFLIPIIGVLTLFAISTWIITPISNLFLRFNNYGKLLLNKKEKMSSNFVAISLLLCLVGIALYFILSDYRFLSLGVFGFGMMIPCSAMYTPSYYKNALLYYAIAMALVGLAAIGTTFATGELFNGASTIFLLGFVAFQWVVNFLLIKKDNL